MSKRKKLPLFLGILTLALGCLTLTPAAADIPPALPSAGLSAIPDYDAASDYSLSKASVLPARYDARQKGYITSVKNQNPWGTCWAFGAIAAGEANLIKKGIFDSSLDLSELHLAYHFFQTPKDPLGNMGNDSAALPTDAKNYLDSGGNNLFTMFALARWTGAADEALAPYSMIKSGVPTLKSGSAFTDRAHLQNARFASTADLASVKRLIAAYGAVSTAFYYDSRYLSASGAYYYPRTASYNNHIVTLVGWDDSYEIRRFGANRPSVPGAWIAKNSYGESFGQNGYFYISYEDVTLNSRMDAVSFAFDLERADNYDHNYQYDGSLGASIFPVPNGEGFANIYTVKGNPGGGEKLKAVSFALQTASVVYSIQIYLNPDPGQPESGTALFSTPQTGYTTFGGYYTVPLKSTPVFRQGDTFSVVVKFRAKKQDYTECFVDYTENTAGIQFTSDARAGESFYLNDHDWIDMTTLDNHSAVARIKAFTSDCAAPKAGTDAFGRLLAAPTLRRAVSSSTSSGYLAWQPVSGARGYKVYRSTSRNGVYRRIATTRNTAFTDTGRRCGVTYYYRIRAYRISGKRVYYSPYSRTAAIRIQPSAPVLQSARIQRGQGVLLSWKTVPGASGYVIYRSTTKSGGYQFLRSIHSAKTLSYLTRPPESGSAYYYRVRAYRTVGGQKIFGSLSSPRGCYQP